MSALVVAACTSTSPTPSTSTAAIESPAVVDTRPTVPPAVADRLQAALDEQRDASGAPGAQAAVVFADGALWVGASGIADVDRDVAVTPETRFAMGSTTKGYTAAVVLGLAAEGVIRLDDPVTKWLPQVKHGDGVTLRHLLLHTSGLAEIPGSDIPAALEQQTDDHLSPDEILLEPECGPGACFHYHSPDYRMLGQVVEKATGNRFAQEVRARIFTPLRLDDSYLPAQEQAEGVMAVGDYYGPVRADDLARFDDPKVDAPLAVAAGGLVGTAGDAARFLDALVTGDVVPAAERRLVTDFEATADLPGMDECAAVAIGTTRGSLAGEEMWGQGGFTGSFHSDVSYVPRRDVTIAAVVNDGGFGPGMISEALARIVYDHAGIVHPELGGGRCNYDIFVQPTNGGARRRLTTHPATDGALIAWSPDGRRIMFGSDRSGSTDVYVMNSDGSSQRAIASGPSTDATATWSPDGERVGFISDRHGDDELFVADVDGSDVTRLTQTSAAESIPAWSPDGAHIAYARADDDGRHVYVARADGSRVRRLTRSKGDEWWPAWSPDSRRVAVLSEGALAIAPASGGRADPLEVNVDGVSDPSWSPGDRLLLVAENDVWSIAPDGTGLRRMTHTPGAREFGPVWSPDGSAFAYAAPHWEPG